LPIQVWYDQLFKAKFGANIKSTLDAVLTLTQGFFKLPTLKTSFTLVVAPYKEIPISLTDGAADSTL
jgi:hypothetical protein